MGFHNIPAAVGGDMLKATYDPDEDGKIALAQLVDAVCSETEADNKIAAYILEGLVEHFQEVPSTGDAVGPEKLNDTDTATFSTFFLNDYVLIELLTIVKITQFRFYKRDQVGSADDGEAKIEYRDPTDGSWNDWVTGKVIPHTTDEWMAWDNSGGQVTCDAIRITCTKVDTVSTVIYLQEMEVKY